MKTKKTLLSLYSFPGFRAQAKLKEILEDPQARVITLKRLQKKLSARTVEKIPAFFMIPRPSGSVISPQVEHGSILILNNGDFFAGRANL